MNCIYKFPSECNTSYTSETARLTGIWIQEYMHNLREGLMEKSKLAHHAYEEGQKDRLGRAKNFAN